MKQLYLLNNLTNFAFKKLFYFRVGIIFIFLKATKVAL